MARVARLRIPAWALLGAQHVLQRFTWARRPHTLCTNKHTNLPPRVTPFLFDYPAGAHTDAQGQGHIAAVHTGETKTAVSTHLPSWFIVMVNNIPGESPIFIFELCDAILMACISLQWPNDKQRACAPRVDNQAAVAAMVKGSSSSTLVTLLASLFRNIAAQGTTLWRIEYVRTKSNDSDTPSRWCNSKRSRMRTYQAAVLPNAFRNAFSPWESVRRDDTVFNNEKINRFRYLFP